MASITPVSQSHLFPHETHLLTSPQTRPSFVSLTLRNSNFKSDFFGREVSVGNSRGRAKMPFKAVVASAAPVEKPKKRYPGEGKGFVEEMRFVAMKFHTRDQAKEGEKEDPDTPPLAKWEPSVEGYLRFLVDSKVVYDTLESIVDKAAHPAYAEFRNTGLERSEKLTKDLDWFKEQNHAIPLPSSPGTSYACYLEELSEKDPPAFICHFYNVYFAHTAGGRMIGKKVAEKILHNKQLEFYKWDGTISQLLQNVREKLNKVAEVLKAGQDTQISASSGWAMGFGFGPTQVAPHM